MNRTKNGINVAKAGTAALMLSVLAIGIAQDAAGEQPAVQTDAAPMPSVSVKAEMKEPGYTAPFETFEFQETPVQMQPEPAWHQVLALLAMYVPNVLIDLADCVSIELGAGSVYQADVFLTRAFGIGAGYGSWEAAGWMYHRQYGTFQQQGWQEHFLFTGSANVLRCDTTGTVQPFWIEVQGFSVPYERICTERIRDYYGIGFDLGLVWSLSVTLHPVAVMDFIAGLFLADPEHDNLKLEPVVPPPPAVPAGL